MTHHRLLAVARTHSITWLGCRLELIDVKPAGRGMTARGSQVKPQGGPQSSVMRQRAGMCVMPSCTQCRHTVPFRSVNRMVTCAEQE